MRIIRGLAAAAILACTALGFAGPAQADQVMQGIYNYTEKDGEARTVKAGDSFIIRPGFIGTWEVIETTLKEYVITV